MITPLFSVTQSENTLTLSIRAPHTRPRDIQIRVDAHDFHFYTSPYLLHLRFEHPLHFPNSDTPTPVPPNTAYDLDTGTVTITLHKLPPYPHFARLDMLSTLLVARPKARLPPSIEVLSSSSAAPSERDIEALQTDTASDLHLPLRELSLGRPRYGFAARYEAVFAVRADDVSQIVELREPDSVPVWRRRSLRRAAEDAKFSRDHYIADFLEPELYEHVLRYRYIPPDTSVPLADDDVDAVLKLPAREYLREGDEGAAADLAGLLYASAYDERVTEGERCVESTWTISRLCASTAFLEAFATPAEAVTAAYRRSLAYPLFRSCAVAEKVLEDLKVLFAVADVGQLRSRLFRVLLELREMFERDSMLRLYCDIFLIDYCVWIQKVGEAVLQKLRDDVLDIQVRKETLGWNLNALEALAVRMANGEDVELKEDNSATSLESGVTKTNAEATKLPNNQIKISALSAFPRAGMELNAIVTRKVDAETNVAEDSASEVSDSSCYDSDLSSCSGSSSSSSAT